MLLKNNVETVINVIGVERNKFIVNQNGDEVSKGNYNHFVIVHTNSDISEKWNNEMIKIDGFNVTEKKVTKSSKTKSKAKPQLDEFGDNAKLMNKEIIEEELLGFGEQKINLDEIDQLVHIAKSRKINIPSTTILADNNWFICPIYSDMKGLYPIIHKKLPNKKGYKLYETTIPLLKFDENLFRADNFKEWNCNCLFILERYLEKQKISEITLPSIYVQRRESESITLLRTILMMHELVQKSRIKAGNTLISLVRYNSGQNEYIMSKENLDKIEEVMKKNNELDDNESEEDIKYKKEQKILDNIVKSYDKLNQKLIDTDAEKLNYEKVHKKILKAIASGDEEKAEQLITKYVEDSVKNKSKTIRLEKTFLRVLDLVTQDEEKESLKIAEDYMKQKQKKNINITLEQALKETKVFRTKDYIPNYTMYQNITIYNYYRKAEAKANKIVADITQETWLWKEYASGIPGLGTLITAYILAFIDFHSTTHSSNVFRYLGMDQVMIKPEHEPGAIITLEEIKKIIKVLYKQYLNIISRSKLTAAMPLIQENFYFYYKTDLITNWFKFQLTTKCFKNLPAMDNIDDIDKFSIQLYSNNEDLKNLVNYIWNNVCLTQISVNGKFTDVVQKRARSRKYDRVTSTYLDSNGQIKFKSGLGYNAKMKSKIIYLLFDNLKRQKNAYYMKIYNDAVNRQIQRHIESGKDPNMHKGHIAAMARRTTMQIFVQELWKFARTYFGLPLNGEGYNDSKIIGCNHIHGKGIEDPKELN